MKRVLLLAMALLCPLTAKADGGAVLWKEIGGWTVYMDQSMGNACYIASLYEGGTVLRLGFDFSGTKGQVYLALGNRNWKSLEAGKDYPIQVQFDNEPIWSATARGRETKDMTWLFVTTTNTSFLDEFARKLGMRASFSGKQIAALKLKGSSKAISEMLDCQKTVNDVMSAKRAPAAPQRPKDPFEQTPAPNVKSASDPFDL